MATSTIVVTYTAGAGEVSDRITSFTVGGTAFGSLTATQLRLARDLGEAIAKLALNPGSSNAEAKKAAKGDK